MSVRQDLHRQRVICELRKLTQKHIYSNVLEMHQVFKTTDGRRIVVIVPFPEYTNFCLNFADKEKLESIVPENEHDTIHILFAKFLEENFCLLHCVPWKRFNFAMMPIENGDLGKYYFIKESLIDGIKHADHMPLFDGLEPLSKEFDGLFE